MRRDGCPWAGLVTTVPTARPLAPWVAVGRFDVSTGALAWPVPRWGLPDLHVLTGTGRPVHKGDVVVLVTNGRFTDKAVAFARS